MLKKTIQKVLYFLPKVELFLSRTYNKFIFWVNGVDYGKEMKISGWIYLKKHKDSKIQIGDNFLVLSGKSLNPLSRNIRTSLYTQFSGSQLYIGNNVGISSSCLWCKEYIKIEDNVKIGADCIIMDTDAHNLDYRYRNGTICGIKGENIDGLTAKSAPIRIEHDVLIGTRCIILKGVTIGAFSVIGSGSVVTKDIPAYSIAAGNPCKVIKLLTIKES